MKALPRAPKVESAPQGKWVNTFGSAGYDLAGWNGTAGDLAYMPNASLTVQQASRYQWAANSADARALSDASGSNHNAGTYYDSNQIQLQLSFKEAYSGELHLYAVDWDAAARREVITVNGQSAVLGGDFSQGAWVGFPISVAAGGTVSITVTRLAGGNAVLSGLFLGNAGAPPAANVASAPQGNWSGTFGGSGLCPRRLERGKRPDRTAQSDAHRRTGEPLHLGGIHRRRARAAEPGQKHAQRVHLLRPQRNQAQTDLQRSLLRHTCACMRSTGIPRAAGR